MSLPLKDLDPNIKLLALLTVFFAVLLIYVDVRIEDDAQVFQVVAGLVTGFGAALLAMLKAKAGINHEIQPPAIAKAVVQAPASPGSGPAAVVSTPAPPAPARPGTEGGK